MLVELSSLSLNVMYNIHAVCLTNKHFLSNLKGMCVRICNFPCPISQPGATVAVVTSCNVDLLKKLNPLNFEQNDSK